jgi:hypothetical protein
MCSKTQYGKTNRTLLAELEIERNLLSSLNTCNDSLYNNSKNRNYRDTRLIDIDGNVINTYACCQKKHEGIDLGLLCPVNERIENLLRYNIIRKINEALLDSYKEETLSQFPDSYEIHVLVKRL